VSKRLSFVPCLHPHLTLLNTYVVEVCSRRGYNWFEIA